MNGKLRNSFMKCLTKSLDLRWIRAPLMITVNAASILLSLIMDLNKVGGGETVFCNPPYGRAISSWVQKAYSEWAINGAEVVMLLPARTDTKWFHDYIYNRAEIRFIKGRLKFGGCKHNAPFPNMIVIFRRLKPA